MADGFVKPGTGPLISVAELQARLDWTLGTGLENIAESVIEDASNLARHYGRATWDKDHVPPVVKTQVRNACVRYLKLVDAVLLSRAAEETEQYTDLRKKTGTVFFDDDEIATIKAAAGGDGNFYSLDSFQYSPYTSSTLERSDYVLLPTGRKPMRLGWSPWP